MAIDLFTDAFGHHVGSVTDLGNGQYLEHDALGHIIGRKIELLDGSFQRQDALGHIIEHIRPFGQALHHEDALHRLVGIERSFGGHVALQDPLGVTIAQYDPCSGNITNALGHLVGRKFTQG